MRILVAASYLVFALRRLLTYLHIFQQEEYDSERFVRWMIGRAAIDRRATAALVAIGLFGLTGILPVAGIYILACAVFLVLAYFEDDPRSSGKKRLAMTPRAKRTLATAIAVTALAGLTGILFFSGIWIWVVAVQIIPFSLVVSNLVLSPYESSVQRRFWQEAHHKLGQLRPITIGITGSYGKTSVKHILGHILGTQAPTLITPGSVNTTMGIARVVREQLNAQHRFFVCEMGAYGRGSILKLTQLAPPSLGIITAIGHAHYERFKTLGAVAEAKFELAHAVAQHPGRVILAEDVLKYSAAQEFAKQHKQSVVAVGTSAACALEIQSVRQGTEGLEVEAIWNGVVYRLRAPLFGEHHGLNIALAFAATCELGVDPHQVIIALASLPQISHRLEVKHQPRGSILIDDAYNSNPVGFASALGILNLLGRKNGRRILATPGMVELGAAHDEEHAKIGKLAASCVDVLLPVLPARIPTMTNAYAAGNPQGTIIPCATFVEAQAWLTANLGPEDVVLIENDLPDLYEKTLRL